MCLWCYYEGWKCVVELFYQSTWKLYGYKDEGATPKDEKDSFFGKFLHSCGLLAEIGSRKVLCCIKYWFSIQSYYLVETQFNVSWHGLGLNCLWSLEVIWPRDLSLDNHSFWYFYEQLWISGLSCQNDYFPIQAQQIMTLQGWSVLHNRKSVCIQFALQK